MQVGPVGQTPPASAGDRKYGDKSSPSSFYPSTPASPGAWVRRSEAPVTGGRSYLPWSQTFGGAPRRGVPEKEAPLRWFGEGAGRPVPGWGGKGSDGGRCPRGRGPAGKSALLRPRRDRKAGPLPPGFESSRVHNASVPTGETESDPSPDRKEYRGRARGCSGPWGGPGGLGEQRSAPARSPKALRWPRTLPLATSGAGSRGAAAQRGGGRGDAKPLKGGAHFGHLGREEKEKGREKREKERRTGRARRRAGGGGAATRDQAGLRASPGRGW